MSCCGPDRNRLPPERGPSRRPPEGHRPQARELPRSTPPEPKDGLIAASKEKARERMAICQACPHARFRPVMHCAKCGCVLAWKTKLKAGTCPVGKW